MCMNFEKKVVHALKRRLYMHEHFARAFYVRAQFEKELLHTYTFRKGVACA